MTAINVMVFACLICNTVGYLLARSDVSVDMLQDWL